LINLSPTVFPYAVVLGELAVGIGLTFGFLTPISAVVAIFMNLNYLVTAGVKPKDISVNPCFRVEQGQNIAMIAVELLIFAAGAWSVWSIDALLGVF
jgi:thiosulfate dehydrogenase [quinone] large subunit